MMILTIMVMIMMMGRKKGNGKGRNKIRPQFTQRKLFYICFYYYTEKLPFLEIVISTLKSLNIQIMSVLVLGKKLDNFLLSPSANIF